ncbi:MAG: hypothetical protein Q4G34_02495 [Micrococcus sp.]|nr:hypothetical protein [Micrococcus sp.]
MTVDTGSHVANRPGSIENTPVAPAPIARPVNSWGLTNRIMILAAVFMVGAEIWKAAVMPQDGLVVLGEGGVGLVPIVVGALAALLGGAMAGVVGAFVVTLMGGPGRSAARYAIGGVVGGVVAVLGVIITFSNTVALHSFWIVVIGLPVAGLLGGIWAGVSSARR